MRSNERMSIDERRKYLKLVYGSDVHYWPEQMKPFWIAVALISVVSERRRSAREKLEEAAEAWGLHRLKTPFGQVMAEMSNTT